MSTCTSIVNELHDENNGVHKVIIYGMPITFFFHPVAFSYMLVAGELFKGAFNYESGDCTAHFKQRHTIVLIGRDGELLQSYRKTHLYDAFSSKESSSIAAGDRLMEPVATEFGKIGLFVCYELRFPEIARALTLKGADILIVPAGWYAGPMKEEHWITLLKARAIENTVFICSSNQTGNAFSGRSLIVDPMGAVLADAGEEEGLHIREIDVSRIGKVREKLPSVTGRREGLYL